MHEQFEFDQFAVLDRKADRIYRWCNTDDRAINRHKAAGYETVLDDKPEIDPRVKGGEAALSPAPGGVTRRRGTDLVLMSISREQHARTIGARRDALRAQHVGASSEDTIERLNEAAVSAAAARGISSKKLVFATSSDGNL